MFLVLLQIALVILRLDGTIDWSWWVVLSPLWVTLTYFVLCGYRLEVEAGEIGIDNDDE